MLSTDDIRDMFSDVFSEIYEDASLEFWSMSTTRDPSTGEFSMQLSSTEQVKVQRNSCTETQKRLDGYSSEDVRFIVLQSGVSGVLNSDSRIVYRGVKYRLFAPIDQDPARAYWSARARRLAD